MEKIGCGQAVKILKKGKKKQATDDHDRLKQAEKKKRRLEKALATSAAIRSELEKKKQKKIEEQQRLDEEGAAIAESVALHVLGEEMDESYPFMLKNDKIYNPWDHYSTIGFLTGCQNFEKYSAGGLRWSTNSYESNCKFDDWGVHRVLPSGVHSMNFQVPYYEETCKGDDLSIDLIAAQAVSSLQIAEVPLNDQFAGTGGRTVVLSRMLGGCNVGNLYKQY